PESGDAPIASTTTRGRPSRKSACPLMEQTRFAELRFNWSFSDCSVWHAHAERLDKQPNQRFAEVRRHGSNIRTTNLCPPGGHLFSRELRLAGLWRQRNDHLPRRRDLRPDGAIRRAERLA